MSEHKHTNRLSQEKSPYLLQHAHNPVDWYPWSDEAFVKAKKEDKPIFLSIGYSTCHWCHVMERESFEDIEVAEILNRDFVAIKVDREERPDIDHIYMEVCQALTGHGGWPMTIFMTHDKKPFYAGTYFPKNDRGSMSGLISILNKIAKVWKDKHEELIESGNEITNMLQQNNTTSQDSLGEEVFYKAYSGFKSEFDSVYGGFGGAPKFPTPHNLYFLLRYWYTTKEKDALEIVEKTLDAMHRGGIYDHIGFSFSRYSTDRKWLVPHFEKMLYDNALLAIAYLETYQETKKEKYAEVARQILTYVLRDMTSPEGGFYSAEDADSEGVEGKFYVWSPDEVKQVLGEDDADRFCKYFDITKGGNFEGKSIPNLIRGALPDSEKVFAEDCRRKLFDYRDKRIHPYKDDKILTAWNGLMIAAMSIGGRVLEDDRYTNAAEKSADFIFSRMVNDNGRLLARFRDGEANFPAYVDDYAFLIWGLTELYETTYKTSYLQRALKLNDDLLRLFWDEENGGLFIYGSDSEQLIARPKEIYDGATPSGNSVATLNFLRLARLTGQHDLEERAHRQFRAFAGIVQRYPRAYSFFLTAFMFAHSPAKEVVVVGQTAQNTADAMLNVLKRSFQPFTISLFYSDKHSELKKLAPFVADYKTVDGETTAYVCENYTCQAPVTDIEQFSKILQ